MIRVLLAEPPLRRLTQLALIHLPGRWRDKARFDAVGKPPYLVGCFYAADQARRQGHDAAAVVEFGVAEGRGLLELEEYAAAVSGETGVRLVVYGFDTGAGMPAGTGDYRDHPDVWAPGDYRMDVPGLRRRLRPATRLVIGEIGQTIETTTITEPLGFVSVDVDYYSSTVDALSLLACTPSLRRVAMYFDDVMDHYNHGEAGELLAIQEFNAKHAGRMVIDPWRGIRHRRPFPDAIWLDGMYLCHDLDQISAARPSRPPARMY